MENTTNEEVVAQEEASTQEKTTAEEKTFTQEQLNNILAKERKAWEKKAEADKEEAKKLARMNAEEKANYEFEKREQALIARELELQTKELQAEAKNMLNERGLPIELHELLPYKDAESVKNGIDTLEKSIQQAVEKAVNERMKGSAPQTASNSHEQPNFFAVGARIK